MPTYEYECNRCGHRFERFQAMSDPPLKKCPECRGQVRRLIGTGAGIIFKGEGFHITDYRSRDYKEKSSAETKTEKNPKSEKSEGSAAPATERKPAGEKPGSAPPKERKKKGASN